MCRRTSTKDPLRQPPNTSRRDKSHEKCLQDICLCLLYTSYLKILCRSHVSDSSFSVHQYGSSTRSTSSDSCLSIFVSQAPLQDPCLWIHVSASMCISGSSARSMSPDPYLNSHMYLRILYKIHVFGFMSQHLRISRILCKMHIFGFMSQHLCISGSSARSMSLDSCLSIHAYLRILCKIHVSGFMSQHLDFTGSSARSMSPDSCLSIFISQGPLQDPCLRIHVSASLYFRMLCKIHVSGSINQRPYVSPDPLQDPCLRIHVSASICISGSSVRSMSPGSCLSIFASQDPRQDPCLRIHVSASSYLRILCKIHVSDSCLSIHVSASMCISGSSARSISPDPYLSSHMYFRILYKIHVFG